MNSSCIGELYGKHSRDTGSAEVQIEMLSKRINMLVDFHFKTHKKDKHGARGLQLLINKRNKLRLYLRRSRRSCA